MKRAAAALALATVTLCAAGANAQSPGNQPAQPGPSGTTAAADPARAAFEAGLAALQDERYADALSYFEQSYSVRRVASVALNLGITLRALGRLVEARERFEEFLTLASPALHERYDHDVAGYLGEIARRVGHVHLATIQPENAAVTVDDHRAMLDSENNVVVDPGEHRVEADAPGYAHFRQSVRVAPGERAEVSVTLVATSTARPTGNDTGAEPGNANGTNGVNGATGNTQPNGGAATNGSGVHADARVTLTPAETGSPIYTRPVFWGAVVGVVVVGAIVAGVVAASSGTQPLPATNSMVDLPAGARWH